MAASPPSSNEQESIEQIDRLLRKDDLKMHDVMEVAYRAYHLINGYKPA